MTNNELERIQANPVQKEIISHFAKIISSQISVPEIAVKGFLWKALRDWQLENGMTIAETEIGHGSSRSERIKQADDILQLLNKMLTKVIKKEESASLTLALDECLTYYIENYADR